MDRIMVTVAIGLALVFGTGVMVGVIAMVAMVTRTRDKRAPDVVARSAGRPDRVGQRDTTENDAGKVRR